MKLSEIKQNIATILNVDSVDAAYIKQHHPNLVTEDMNLRTKEAWLKIYEALTLCESDVDESVIPYELSLRIEQNRTYREGELRKLMQLDSTAMDVVDDVAPSSTVVQNNTSNSIQSPQTNVCSTEQHYQELQQQCKLIREKLGYPIKLNSKATVLQAYFDKHIAYLDEYMAEEDTDDTVDDVAGSVEPPIDSTEVSKVGYEIIPFPLVAVAFFTVYLWCLMFGAITTFLVLCSVLLMSVAIAHNEKKIRNALYKARQRLTLAFIGFVLNIA